MGQITTKRAAEILGLSVRRVQSLLKNDEYKAEMKAKPFGRDWALDEDAVKVFARKQRKTGRPRKRGKRLTNRTP